MITSLPEGTPLSTGGMHARPMRYSAGYKHLLRQLAALATHWHCCSDRRRRCHSQHR